MKASDLDEGRRKRKRKARRSLYGPGPYGMYGTDTGYSGDSGGVAEDITPEKTERIKEFVKFCFKKLKLQKKPRIRLSNKIETTALGYFVPNTNTIVVVVKGRHLMDILRTLAHELVHLKQSETRELDGSTGSIDENEANAMAGIILRVWGKLHPAYFEESRKFTDLELAIMEGGGSIEDNKTYTIRKKLEQVWKDQKMKITEIISEAKAPEAPKPRTFVAKTGSARSHKDKKKDYDIAESSFVGSIASGLGAGMAAGAAGPLVFKKKNQADLAFANQIPEGPDKKAYLEAVKKINHARTMSLSGPAFQGVLALEERNFNKFKESLATKYNIKIIESATAGATSTANIGTVINPHISPGKARGKKSYIGDPWGGKSGTKAPPQPKVVQPKNPNGTAKGAHDLKGVSLFGGGAAIKR